MTASTPLRKVLATLLIVCFTNFVSLPGFGQPHNKKKNDKQVRTSEEAPEYTESDKEKMAKIADRPEVKQRIEDEWQAQRLQDMQFGYIVFKSTQFAEMSGPQAAEFNSKYGQLYDNPILQQYVNNIGQALVPKDTPNVYAFKLLYDPLPRAEAYSTGSVYISTGLVAMLDNEAQLAYVLGHEIAHVEKNHFYREIRNRILEEELYKEKERELEKKRRIASAVAAGVGAGLGAGIGHAVYSEAGNGAIVGALAGGLGGYVASQFLFRNRMTVTEWKLVDENEADDAGFNYMLEQNYDVREVPRLYATLRNSVTKDSRVGLGFVGRLSRVQERTAHAQTLIAGAYKATIDTKLKSPGLKGTSPEFSLIMAALKRDNGIRALEYDLYDTARENLQQAVSIRSNDALAQLYLGKVTLVTARTPEDHLQAEACFRKALQYDEGRGAYPDPHLEHAISLIAQNNSANSDEIKRELQTYVALYRRNNGGRVPNNMRILYDYFTIAGDSTWYVPPVSVVSTEYGSALRVTDAQEVGVPTAKEITAEATTGDVAAPAQVAAPAPAPPKHPRAKTVSAPH